jgi:hypothetical protein
MHSNHTDTDFILVIADKSKAELLLGKAPQWYIHQRSAEARHQLAEADPPTHPSGPYARSILFTAYGREEIPTPAYNLKICQYITKPCDPRHHRGSSLKPERDRAPLFTVYLGT